MVYATYANRQAEMKQADAKAQILNFSASETILDLALISDPRAEFTYKTGNFDNLLGG